MVTIPNDHFGPIGAEHDPERKLVRLKGGGGGHMWREGLRGPLAASTNGTHHHHHHHCAQDAETHRAVQGSATSRQTLPSLSPSARPAHPLHTRCTSCMHACARAPLGCVSAQGVRVGMFWKDRLDCRQWGAHFPHVAGIAGQSNAGAQSVVLSGGYEDDRDEGEWFLYTGSGGRDLSGNKRTNKLQSFDQVGRCDVRCGVAGEGKRGEQGWAGSRGREGGRACGIS